MTRQADGHTSNQGQRSRFSVVEVGQILRRFGDTNIVGAFDLLVTVTGQNSIEAVYPNLSIFYYWSQTGKVLMR